MIGDTKRHSSAPKDGPSSPFRSRPSSVVSATQVGHEGVERRNSSRQPGYQTTSIATQTSIAVQTSGVGDSAPSTVHESLPSAPHKEIITYSIGTQTSDPLPDPPRRPAGESSESDEDLFPSANPRSPRSSRLYGRRSVRREEELRQQIRREVEEELKAIKDPAVDGSHAGTQARFPARNLTQEEASTLASSDAFADFVDRAGKVVERALDSEYDLLADYAALDGFEEVDEDEDEGYASARGKKSRKLKEVAQFYDHRWSRRRMISDVSFSPKVSHAPSPPIMFFTNNQNHSLQNFSWHPTPKTLPHHKIHQVSSNYGACIFVPAQNTSSIPPPTSSPPNSPPSTHGTSSAGPTPAKSSFGTCATAPPCPDSRRHWQVHRQQERATAGIPIQSTVSAK